MNEMIEKMKTEFSDFWNTMMENVGECDDLFEMLLFVFLSGVLLLAGFGIIFLLGMLLVRAPAVLLILLVSFGIPTGFLAWAKREKRRKDNYDIDGM